MAGSLATYRKKRDFTRTREPRPSRAKPRARKSLQDLSFVVQEHHARRLHYDFRLELDGVLLSWAVPKGPSLEPGVKRLAVRTEDHPLEYGAFEGDIPEGEYGAGHVAIWDRGTWRPEGEPHAALERGRLTFELFGERLRGGFHLVRSASDRGAAKKEGASWLLIKRKPAHQGGRPSDAQLAALHAAAHAAHKEAKPSRKPNKAARAR